MPLAPEYQALLAQLAEQPGPKFTELSPEEGRAMYRLARPVNEELPIGRIEDRQVPTADGDIPIRIYTPEGEGPFGILVNFHGGGWVIGDLETADSVCREMATLGNCIVISVDYRLAPEHPYPAAVDDAYAATCWTAENASALGGSGRLGVGGESAGGNLAAVVCQKARDEQGPEIHFQFLAYPVTDHDFTRDSYARNGEGRVLDLDTMTWFWDLYCPDTTRRSEPAASPLLSQSFDDLPPAMIITAEYDPLVDEGQAYAQELADAGVPTEYVCFDGLVHDFLAHAPLMPCSRRAFDRAAAAVKAALA
jgi:acetyl esterase